MSQNYRARDGQPTYSHICRKCRIGFSSPNDWSTLCKICWLKDKEQEEAKREREKYQPPPRQNQNPAQTIPDDIYKRLVMLCHPDKHGGSEMSVKVTQWLNGLKNK
jgi:hypothetical protein